MLSNPALGTTSAFSRPWAGRDAAALVNRVALKRVLQVSVLMHVVVPGPLHTSGRYTLARIMSLMDFKDQNAS